MSKAEQINCVMDCRISSTKQQTGGGLDDQQMVCENYANRNGWNTLKVFSKVYSGRAEERADFEEILDYIKDEVKRGVKVHNYLFKSIDRFTRDGAVTFEEMKDRLILLGVNPVDAYGVIQPKQNTLAHLGFEYKWSMKSPTATAQLMEAQRAKDEVTDILTRMVGAEITLVREGYKVRPPTDGFLNSHIMVDGKKKVIEEPDPIRAKYFIEMFNLLESGTLSDQEVVDRINAMGYRSKQRNIWNKEHTKIIGHTGGLQLNVKQLQRITRKTIYAGYKCEKWTDHKLVRAKYDGLVSVDTFNRANKGRVYIKVADNNAELLLNFNPNRTKARQKNNPLFPYKFIRCHCGKPYCASSPKGKSGQTFPTYHCSRNHKYVGIPKKNFEEKVEGFINGLKFNPDYLNSLEITFLNKYREREKEIIQSSSSIHLSIGELKAKQAQKIEAIVATNSEVVRRQLENEVEELEVEIREARKESTKLQISENDIKSYIKDVKRVMEHPSELLLDQDNLTFKENMFGLVFEEIPTYQEILNGTPKLHWIFDVSLESDEKKNQPVTPPGVEPGFQA